MNQILIRLYVPNFEKSYDVWIPAQRRIANVITLLLKAINELNYNIYKPALFPMLYNKDTAEMYDPNALVKDANIRNGAEIIML